MEDARVSLWQGQMALRASTIGVSALAIVAVAVVISPTASVLLPVGVGGVYAMVKRPAYGALALIPVLFLNLSRLPFLPPALTLVRLLTALLITVLVAELATGPRRLLLGREGIFLTAMLGVALLGMVGSHVSPRGLSYVAGLALALVLYVLCTNLLDSEALFETACLLVIASSGALATAGILEYLQGGAGYRVAGLHAEGSMRFGMLLAYSLPIVVAVAQSAKDRYVRIAVLGVLLVVLVGIGLSGTTAALISGAAGLVITLRRRQLVALATATVIGVAVIGLCGGERLQSVPVLRDATKLRLLIDPAPPTIAEASERVDVGNRISSVYESLHLFAAHPLLGAGSGNFARALNRSSGFSHMLFLRTLAENGILGFIALCLAVGTALSSSWRGYMRFASVDERAAWLRRGVFASLVSLTLGMMAHGAGFELSWGVFIALATIQRATSGYPASVEAGTAH